MAKKVSKTKIKKLPKGSTKEQQQSEDDQFDFGGFPKGVSLKKNLGCGG